MSDRTQIEIGAQTRAAQRVDAKQGEFQQQLTLLSGEVDGLRASYTGQSASSFFELAESWLDDARAIIAEFSSFSERLTRVDQATTAAEDEQAAAYRQNVTPLQRRLG